MSRRSPARSKKTGRGRKPPHPAPAPAASGRAKVVWGVLLGCMTLVGGGLLAVQGRPIPKLDGLSLSAIDSPRTAATLESIFQTRSAVDASLCSAIVIHHSGTRSGSPAAIAAQHEALGFSGLGHHFIIGNGSGMGDGELHVGYRWLDQLPGAHAAGANGDAYNRHSISICLVGDGNRRSFTPAQMRRLVELTSMLCHRLQIPPEQVLLHSDIAARSDPGRLFPAAEFEAELARRF